MSTNKNERVALRLASILIRLNNGERLHINELMEEFSVSRRTLQKDFHERLAFLQWKENQNGYYSVDRSQFGLLSPADIQRFARFASISELFPQIDRTFYQENLIQSVQVKGFQYENIKDRQKEFKALQQAIENKNKIAFHYIKANEKQGKDYQLEPYALINKNGIWYLIGLENHKQKTFCFTQIKTLIVQPETFELNPQFLKEIKQSDSLFHGNQISEIIIKVDKKVSSYFLRRDLLPNQETIKKLDDGGLLLQCKNINEMEVIPLVQYWIPYLTIISPEGLQGKLIENLRSYISNFK